MSALDDFGSHERQTHLRGTMLKARYQDLGNRMKAQAEEDGDIFLPNPAPEGPVDYVLVCMEPSLGRWAATAEIAVEKIGYGFHNFMYSIEDFILHFCANRYLCGQGQSYFVTDVSKGAMLVEKAGQDRVERYNRWHELLIEELGIILQPSGKVIAVGNAVAKHFQVHGLRNFSSVMHYSGQAAATRNAAIVGHEREYAIFRDRVNPQDIVDNAKQYMLTCGIPATIFVETHARVSKAKLTDSRLKLMFIYKTALESIRKS